MKHTLIIGIAFLLVGCSNIQKNKNTDTVNINRNITLFLDSFPELKKVVDGLEKGNKVESSHIYYEGRPSEQYAKYEWLKKNASSEQLETLTNHKNAAVRCYAFQALAAQKSNNVFNVLLNHLHDITVIETQSGCIGGECYVGDYFIDVVTPDYIEVDVYKLNSKEKEILDSVLLFDNSITLTAKSTVLMELEPLPKYYDKVKELVSVERNESALRTLAKYQKQTDKELIASFFQNKETQFSALYAVRDFFDDYFYPFVTKVFEQEWEKELYDYPKWRICYQALAKYPRQETIQLFERTVNTKDEFRYQTLCEYLLLAITKYPNILYEPIKANIKLDEFQMDEVKYQLESGF